MLYSRPFLFMLPLRAMAACITDAERRELVWRLKQNGQYFNHYDMDTIAGACPPAYRHMASAVRAAFCLCWSERITSTWSHARVRQWLSERSMPSNRVDDAKALAPHLTWWMGVEPASPGSGRQAAFYLFICLGDATRRNTVAGVGIVGDGLPKYKVGATLGAQPPSTPLTPPRLLLLLLLLQPRCFISHLRGGLQQIVTPDCYARLLPMQIVGHLIAHSKGSRGDHPPQMIGSQPPPPTSPPS